jgi:hypothetical protein
LKGNLPAIEELEAELMAADEEEISTETETT